VRRSVVEPVVRQERVGVSTNGVMDYASWSDVPFPTKKRATGEEKRRRAVNEGLSSVREFNAGWLAEGLVQGGVRECYMN